MIAVKNERNNKMQLWDDIDAVRARIKKIKPSRRTFIAGATFGAFAATVVMRKRCDNFLDGNMVTQLIPVIYNDTGQRAIKIMFKNGHSVIQGITNEEALSFSN